jgi:DNA-binding NtrC family response regulator
VTPSVLIVDDQASIAHFLSRALGEASCAVRTAGSAEQARSLLKEEAPDVVFLDLKLPDANGLDLIPAIRESAPEATVVVMTAFGDVESAVRALKEGAAEFLTKPVNLDQLKLLVSKAVERQSLLREVKHHRAEQSRRLMGELVRGESAPMQELLSIVERVAASESTSVLIEGESGTGKQVIAKLIHQLSPRAARPFVELNCAAIPSELLESELFGHERGAFTDAKSQKQGLLELADEGTLFLDEIGEMPATLQVKLLKVLEGMTFRRVGGTKDVRVSVRILSATNRDLRTLCRVGQFREDLYYRLKVVPLLVPPLRERGADVLIFARHFLQQFSKQFGKRFRGLTPAAERRLLAYDWPGNIRELRNLFEQSVLLEDAEVLDVHHLRLPEEVDTTRSDDALDRLLLAIQGGSLPAGGLDYEAAIGEIERRILLMASEATHWNQSRTARFLGLGRDKLRYRMKVNGVRRDEPDREDAA